MLPRPLEFPIATIVSTVPARYRERYSSAASELSTITPESCSRCAGIRVHIELESLSTISRNTQHTRLRTGQAGRQWGLGAINRAVVVLCVSAWEAYLEELVREALEGLRPPGPEMGSWPALKPAAMSEIGRFNNPNVENATRLFASCIGLADIAVTWGWKNCTRDSAREYLNAAGPQESTSDCAWC
jgi:hypothetical protein